MYFLGDIYRNGEISYTYKVINICNTELDKFMRVLEQRLSKKQQQLPTGLVARKIRRDGVPSDTLPPPGAPVWAVRKDDQELCSGT